MNKQIQAIIDKLYRLDQMLHLLKSGNVTNPKELSEDIDFLEDTIKHQSISYLRILVDYIEELEYRATDNSR